MARRPTDFELSIYEALLRWFSKEEIASLGWELRLDVEDMDWSSKQLLARGVIEYAAATRRTKQLAQLVLRERPHARVAAEE